MRADGGEAVEVRKHEGLAEGANEEDGRHGLRGCSEVKRRGRPPWSPRMKRTAAMRAGPDAEQAAKEGRRGPKGRRRSSTPGNQSQPSEDGRHGLLVAE